MTEKIIRRGTRVPAEYGADFLEQVLVGTVASKALVTLKAEDSLGGIRRWLHAGSPEAHHQGFPVIDNAGHVRGLVTRRDILDPAISDTSTVLIAIKRPLLTVRSGASLREAADLMVREDVGRLLVVPNDGSSRVVGIITRADLLSAHGPRLAENQHRTRGIRWRGNIGGG